MKSCKCAKQIQELQKKYNKSIQDTKGNIHLLKNWITDTLELNRQMSILEN